MLARVAIVLGLALCVATVAAQAPVPQTANPVLPGQPSNAESSEVPQSAGPVPVLPEPPKPVATKPQKVKRALPVRARYYGQKKSAGPAQYSLPEYGDPNPKKTAAAAAKAAKRGTPVHPRVFTANYLSPLPASHPRVKCYGRGKREKCYRVDRAGRVLGRHAHRPLPRVVAETRSLHAMEKKGFQTAEYDDKLAQWKPRKHKRTLSPAPVISLMEVDAADEAQDEAEADDEDEAEDEAEDEVEDEVEDEADDEIDA